ncbi:kelch repeat protein [Aspergillus piperis CBS 112811]|uniref:Kelch repeat protein n=1 Tax=Aspergillus piperis CBS 112811 TaxID=1448313 RepID=A0A8G1QTP3_9EURO|nr:kelch repeat protein [Aspergillus piperis CBS 112811]RAH53463.1 kelch repeat protein [Aspergillus piperis CBS 112811]
MPRAVWTKLLSDVSIKRSSQTLAILASNAYIYGGELRPREPVDSAVYRLSLDASKSSNHNIIQTSPSASHPQPRVGSASTALAGRLYIFSGRGGIAMAPIEESGTFWVFDPTQNTWSQLAPATSNSQYPVGRSYHTLTNNGTDTIYLHGGCPSNGRLRDLWAFNIHSRQWLELPPAPGPERGGASIAYADQRIYRMNGFDGTREQGGSLDVYNVQTNEWTSLTYASDGISGPSPRSVGCLLATMIGGRQSLVTMFGEHDPSSLGHQGAGKMLADIWAFDLQSQRWAQVDIAEPNRPPARGWFDADVIGPEADANPGSIVIHGGLAETNERLDDVWRLDFV